MCLLVFHDSTVVAPLKPDDLGNLDGDRLVFHDSTVVAPLKPVLVHNECGLAHVFHDSTVVAPLKPGFPDPFADDPASSTTQQSWPH